MYHKIGLESLEYGRRYPSRWPHGILYPQKLALTSPTSGGRSVGIVRSRTRATEFLVFCIIRYAGQVLCIKQLENTVLHSTLV
jgi:hypothetical protein